MKIVVEEIVTSHPAKSSITFRRERIGVFVVDGTFRFDRHDTLWLGHHTDKLREVTILAARTMTWLHKTDGEIVLLLDVVSATAAMHISTALGVYDHDEELYIKWAIEHGVWP